MLSTARRSGLDRAIASISSPAVSIPSFLVPALHAQHNAANAAAARRPFSVSAATQSHVGRAPISIPPEVKVTVAPVQGGGAWQSEAGKLVEIEGPLGKLSMTIPTFVTIDQDSATRKATVSILDREERKQRAMWGTVRAYLQNHVLGVSEGHTAILRLVGVGYRATVEDSATTVQPEYNGQKFVNLKVGYSHPIELGIPMGVKASTPQPTRLLLEGPEKEVLMQFAAKIRKWRVPEPYKGKGIFVNDETIRLKAKKIK